MEKIYESVDMANDEEARVCSTQYPQQILVQGEKEPEFDGKDHLHLVMPDELNEIEEISVIAVYKLVCFKRLKYSLVTEAEDYIP